MHYSFQTEDKLYFVMEYVAGGELYTYLNLSNAAGNCFNEKQIRFYAAEITVALQTLH